MKWADFKPVVVEAVVVHLEPIEKRFAEVRADEDYSHSFLKEAAGVADEIALLNGLVQM